ncbi:MAG: hypothetical protein MUF00_09305 [Gemmatimonadaceae bacterium]|jgi:hypothetical protein|nr:hypothetical protein [Gemmatimonadaceae bacterium]
MLNDRFDASARGDATPEFVPTPSAGAREDALRPEAEAFADREVPLRGVRPAMAVQQWLDGDVDEAVARAASPADVDVWHALGTAYAAKADVKAPAGFEDRVMAALPARPMGNIAPRAD